MSLRPLRQPQEINIDFITPFTQERGGCLTFANPSGMYIVQYDHGFSNKAAGIQLNDIEWMNLSRQYHRQYRNGAMTDVPCGIAGMARQGDYITDWLFIIGSLTNGDPAYVGPSGTFTNSSSFGEQVGKFISPLNEDPHFVVMRGLGFSYTATDPCTKRPITENDPADRVLIHSPGYAKIHINI